MIIEKHSTSVAMSIQKAWSWLLFHYIGACLCQTCVSISRCLQLSSQCSFPTMPKVETKLGSFTFTTMPRMISGRHRALPSIYLLGLHGQGVWQLLPTNHSSGQTSHKGFSECFVPHFIHPELTSLYCPSGMHPSRPATLDLLARVYTSVNAPL